MSLSRNGDDLKSAPQRAAPSALSANLSISVAQFSQCCAFMTANAGKASLAQLLEADVPFDSHDVAAIVGEVCLLAQDDQIRQGPLPLTPGKVWLDRSGAVTLSPATRLTVRDLGDLLEILLLAPRRRSGTRFPPGLLIASARAIGQIDLPPFASPAELATALARFQPADRADAIQGLVARWATTQVVEEAPPLPVEGPRAPVEDLFDEAPVEMEGVEAAEGGNEGENGGEYEGGNELGGELGIAPRAPRHGWRTPRLIGLGFTAGVFVALALNPTKRLLEEVLPTSGTTSRVQGSIQEFAEQTLTAVNPDAADRAARGRAAAKPGDRESARAPGNRPSASRSGSANPRTSNVRPTTSEQTAGRGVQPLIGSNVRTADAMFSPSFASNGSAVFFHAEASNGSALKRADRGSEGAVLHVATIVDDGAKNYHVQLSPDGKAVAFDSDRDGVRGVYVARPDGTNVRRVSGDGYSAVPTWSPDGNRLAMLRAEPNRPKVWNLWVLDVSTGQMTRLTDHRYGQVWGGSWFPDGRRIAYSLEDRLIVLDMASRTSAAYASPRQGHLVRTPAVSPDGRWMMFQVFRDGAWLLDLADGSMRRVLDDPTAEEFTWAPDGRRVAFHSRRNGQWGLWMMAAR
jgi:Tol biopolymer transport system component